MIGGTGRMSGGTRRIWLVARREWNQRVRTTAFRVSTILSVAVVVALIMVPEMYGGGANPIRTIGLVGASSPQLPEVLTAAGDRLELTVKTREFGDGDAARIALRDDEVTVILIDQRELVWKAEADEQLGTTITSAIGFLERQAAIDELGLTAAEADRLLQPPELASSSLDPATEEETARADLGRVGVVLLFLMIAFYGGFVLVGVVEEKSSRVVEVLLSRVRPAELLAGKVLGIGLVGLAQFAIVVGAALAALSVSDNTVIPETASGTLGWVVFWFVLGFAFYSVLYAAAGALVSRQEETQSLVFPMTAVQLVAYVLAFAASESPGSAAAVLGSLFPPTAPMVMIVRIAHGGVPLWQIAAAVAIMGVTVAVLVRLAARIYAGGVLRFGARVPLREAWRGAEV
ncbi:MAG TPA: ABC transporter permease [Actinomycetota bacterium]